MTHTPGPWHNNGDLIVGGNVLICSKAMPENAYLLAAAPDLLALLKEGVRLYLKAGFAETGQWVTEANAAIAKAEGKS